MDDSRPGSIAITRAGMQSTSYETADSTAGVTLQVARKAAKYGIVGAEHIRGPYVKERRMVKMASGAELVHEVEHPAFAKNRRQLKTMRELAREQGLPLPRGILTPVGG